MRKLRVSYGIIESRSRFPLLGSSTGKYIKAGCAPKTVVAADSLVVIQEVTAAVQEHLLAVDFDAFRVVGAAPLSYSPHYSWGCRAVWASQPEPSFYRLI